MELLQFLVQFLQRVAVVLHLLIQPQILVALARALRLQAQHILLVVRAFLVKVTLAAVHHLLPVHILRLVAVALVLEV
jgi:hypothetical protein